MYKTTSLLLSLLKVSIALGTDPIELISRYFADNDDQMNDIGTQTFPTIGKRRSGNKHNIICFVNDVTHPNNSFVKQGQHASSNSKRITHQFFLHQFQIAKSPFIVMPESPQ